MINLKAVIQFNSGKIFGKNHQLGGWYTLSCSSISLPSSAPSSVFIIMSLPKIAKTTIANKIPAVPENLGLLCSR